MIDWEDVVKQYPALEGCREDVQAVCAGLKEGFTGGGKLLVCGNGGSSADGEHIVGELMKGFLLARPVDAAARERLISLWGEQGSYLAQRLQGGLPALCLSSHTALGSAIVNDTAGDMLYAQQVWVLGQPGDMLLGLSTSGNAANVCRAAQAAAAKGMLTIGMTGRDGGKLAGICRRTIKVPADQTYRVQEYHLPVYHYLCAWLEEEFFGK